MKINDLLDACLCKNFFAAFHRKNKYHSFKENGVDYLFKSPVRATTAFRMETHKLKIFADSPPEGIAKMCDAVFGIHYKNKDYLIIVEVKTRNKDKYKKQLINARLFCQWQVALLQEHGHIEIEPQYVGLLIWQPNPSQIPKGTTTYSQNKPDEQMGKMPIYSHNFIQGEAIPLQQWMR